VAPLCGKGVEKCQAQGLVKRDVWNMDIPALKLILSAFPVVPREDKGYSERSRTEPSPRK
jgi:hypothetical protein